MPSPAQDVGQPREKGVALIDVGLPGQPAIGRLVQRDAPCTARKRAEPEKLRTHDRRHDNAAMRTAPACPSARVSWIARGRRRVSMQTLQKAHHWGGICDLADAADRLPFGIDRDRAHEGGPSP